MAKKRYAIIGAGVAGAAAAKALLDEGFEVVVFEKTDYTFGMFWYSNLIN